MRTIGAKELRLHLDQVLDRVLAGEDIIVSHRFKGPIKISAVHSSSAGKDDRLAGLRAFDESAKRKVNYNPDKTIKELYRESISKKHIS